MTRIEFFFNVPDKLAKVAELCEKEIAKGRKVTVHTQSDEMNTDLQNHLWQHSATSFLPSSKQQEVQSDWAPLIIDCLGDKLIQDDVLINLQLQHPSFFSRFRYLAELVGIDEADKAAARIRYRFYKDRGYEVSSIDTSVV